MWLGIHPYVDSGGDAWPLSSYGADIAGRPIFQNERFGVLWEVIGDLDHHVNVLHLPHYSTPSPCWLCQGNRTHLNFLDWRTTAPWRATIKTWREATTAPRRQHPLYQELTYVNDLAVRPGWMHSFDLGILLYLHGGAFRTLIGAETTCLPGCNAKNRAPIRPTPPDTLTCQSSVRTWRFGLREFLDPWGSAFSNRPSRKKQDTPDSRSLGKNQREVQGQGNRPQAPQLDGEHVLARLLGQILRLESQGCQSSMLAHKAHLVDFHFRETPKSK